MWNASSTATQLATSFGDTGNLLTIAITSIMVGLIALLVLGFAIRHLKKYVTGRKF